MAASAGAAASEQSQRAWWLRSLLVLQSPRAVFAALRDDSEEAAHARQEPITALVVLAGIGAVLGGSPTTGRLLDDPEIDGLLAAVLVFLAGGLYGFFGYWVGGGALYAGARAAGGEGSYRRARHVLAFAATPLALALVVLPLRVALYGGDSFRTGGGDSGAGGDILDGIELALAGWALILLLFGIRGVYRLSWSRSLAVVALGVLTLLAVVLVFALFG